MAIDFNFAFYLLIAVLLTGLLSLIFKGYMRTLFLVLLVVWFIRSFLVQPYRVPTGSLEPTILPGDFIAVSEYNYGIRFPVFHWLLMKTTLPQRGDIALFHWPVNPRVTYVKRVIGVPGDHIQYRDKQLYINGQKCPQTLLKKGKQDNRYREQCPGFTHQILIAVSQYASRHSGQFSLVVPKGEYFMMGDNRDASNDSRSWGFVPYKNFIGKAFIIWFSWDANTHSVRWSRIGMRIA